MSYQHQSLTPSPTVPPLLSSADTRESCFCGGDAADAADAGGNGNRLAAAAAAATENDHLLVEIVEEGGRKATGKDKA